MKRLFVILAVAVVALAAVSCGSKKKGDAKEASTPFVTPTGIGKIEIGERIDDVPASLNGLYDSIEAVEETEYAEGGDEWTAEVFYAKKDGQRVFKIIPDEGKIWHIEVISPELKTESGLGIDSTVEELFAAGGKAYCGIEWWEYYDGILCEDLIFTGFDLSPKGEAKIADLDDGDFIKLELSDLKEGSKPHKLSIPDDLWRNTIKEMLQ